MGIVRTLLGTCLGWLLMLAAVPAHADQTVVLTDGTPSVPLSPYVVYYHDVAAKDSLQVAAHRLAENQFTRLPDDSAAFGFQKGAYWFHVRLLNRSPREPRWVLVQQYALSDHFDVYANYADGRMQHWKGGDALSFNQGRSVRYRHPNVLIDLPREQPVDVFVRVQSQSSMQVPLTLYTQPAFTEMSRDAQLGMGVYYGILLALFFYNMVLWLSLRDASYVWDLLHISAFGLVRFTALRMRHRCGWSTHYVWTAESAVVIDNWIRPSPRQGRR